jgi:alanyl-tRNA synthetase
MKTIRLFDQNSHLYTFEATVLSAEAGKTPDTLSVVLDATAFFPEGGGQYPDRGTLGGCPVTDVQEKSGIAAGMITHTVSIAHLGGEPHPFAVGATVTGELDVSTRFLRMQNHTGEHIVSGIVHRLYGYRNVGFHLGDRGDTPDVTLDFDGVLTREQLNAIEDEANAIVAACLPVTAYYPAPEELSAMTYRAKLDLTEGVRIVRIGTEEDVKDTCACCAPHVDNTGEIGLIKLLDFIHYKGGVRIHMLCGAWALADYRRRYTAVASMAAAMSVKQEEVTVGFERLQAEIENKKQIISTLRGKLEAHTVAAITPTEGSLCLFDEGLEALEMRRLLNAATEKCGRLCGVFSGNDTEGYRYVIGRGDASIDLKQRIKEINAALSARGGGSSEMLQGSCTATRAVIEAFFEGY